jgi:hypothetical protein
MAAQLRAGDVLRFECASGFAYVSYVGRHPIFGDTIWVVPELFAEPVNDWAVLFDGDGYYAFYPAHTTVKHGLATKVGYSTNALRVPPTKWRIVVNCGPKDVVVSWLIEDGVTRVSRQDAELSPEERMIPIASIWNHEYLCHRIVEGWTPFHDYGPLPSDPE